MSVLQCEWRFNGAVSKLSSIHPSRPLLFSVSDRSWIFASRSLQSTTDAREAEREEDSGRLSGKNMH